MIPVSRLQPLFDTQLLQKCHRLRLPEHTNRPPGQLEHRLPTVQPLWQQQIEQSLPRNSDPPCCHPATQGTGCFARNYTLPLSRGRLCRCPSLGSHCLTSRSVWQSLGTAGSRSRSLYRSGESQYRRCCGRFYEIGAGRLSDCVYLRGRLCCFERHEQLCDIKSHLDADAVQVPHI